MLVRCPICQKQFESEQSPVMPFCCQRCRMVDLGRWLGEKYGMPLEPGEEREPPEGMGSNQYD
jgi:uncharacterized protein